MEDQQAQTTEGTVADKVRAGTKEALDAGKESTRSFMENRKGALVSQMSGIAGALRNAARDVESESTANFVRRTADRMEHLADSMQQQDLRGILDQTDQFARRSPGVFVGGAVTAGFLLARFLKSSKERSEHQSGGDSAFGDTPEEGDGRTVFGERTG